MRERAQDTAALRLPHDQIEPRLQRAVVFRRRLRLHAQFLRLRVGARNAVSLRVTDSRSDLVAFSIAFL